MKQLRALVRSRPSWSQYLGRLAYTRFRIDLLSTKVTDPVLESALSASIHFLSVAVDIWAAVARSLGDRSPAERVDDIKAVIRKSQGDCEALRRLQAANARAIDGDVEAAWLCASDKITDVERLVAAR